MADPLRWAPDDPLARCPGETERGWLALRDYALLGPVRSLDKLLDRYQTATKPGPTKRRATLCEWSKQFAWQARIAAWECASVAALEAEELTARAESRRRQRELAWRLYELAIEAIQQSQGNLTGVRPAEAARIAAVAIAALAADCADGVTDHLDALRDIYGEERVKAAIAALTASNGPEVPAHG